MRNRSVVFVIRNRKILMEKLYYDGSFFYSIPGGGIEEGETPEQETVWLTQKQMGELRAKIYNLDMILSVGY